MCRVLYQKRTSKSVCWPVATFRFFFSKWPTIKCRGKPSVDGYFATAPSDFGCPKTEAERTIKVSPFLASVVRMSYIQGDIISPDLQQFDDLLAPYSADFDDVLTRSMIRFGEGPPRPSVPPPLRRRIHLAGRRRVISPASEPNLLAAGNCESSSCVPGLSASECGVEGDIDQKCHGDTPSDMENVSNLTHSDSKGQRARSNPAGSRNPSSTRVRSRHVDCYAQLDAEQRRQLNLPKLGDRCVFFSTGECSEAVGRTALPKCRFKTTDLLRIALNAEEPKILDELFILGVADAFRWIRLEQMRQRREQLDALFKHMPPKTFMDQFLTMAQVADSTMEPSTCSTQGNNTEWGPRGNNQPLRAATGEPDITLPVYAEADIPSPQTHQ